MYEILWMFFTSQLSTTELLTIERTKHVPVFGSVVPSHYQVTKSKISLYFQYQCKKTFLRKYSSKFSRFLQPTTKMWKYVRSVKIWTFEWTFELVEICTRAFCVLVLLDLTMALYHYFKPADAILLLPREICQPGDNKGAWSIAHAKCEN